MSGHLRFCFVAFVFLASLSTSPASSNSFADFFNFAPRQATAPAPAEAEEECLSRPGKSTTAGQHWVYRFDGRRKCWFQTDEAMAVKKQVRQRAAKSRVTASEENEADRRKRKAVVDARAELLRSASAETSSATPLAPKLKLADAASVGAAALVPPAPVANGVANQLTPGQPTSRQVDVETLLSAAPAASKVVAASVPLATFPLAEAADDGWSSAATWIGMLLMALGLVSVLASSRTLREAMPLRDLMRGRLGTQWGRERQVEGGRVTSRQQADYFSA